MTYKLIAFDIDGTIRTPEHGVTDRTRAAVDMARDAGAIVTLATGRMFFSALEATKELRLTSPVVAFQGAMVADPVTRRPLWHRPLTAEKTLAALDALNGWKGEVLAYHEDRVYANILTPWVEAYSERNKGKVHVVDDLRDIAEREPTRLALVGDDADVYAFDLLARGAFSTELYVTRSLPNFCEILHPETGKHRGLAWLADRLGVDREQVVALGNGYEDAPMIEWAGLGAAVSDGAPEALAAADTIVGPVDQDGAARLVEELVQSGRIG